jgi:hypothetical protein
MKGSAVRIRASALLFKPFREEEPGSPTLVDRFCERAADYGAAVTWTQSRGVETALVAVCAARRA